MHLDAILSHMRNVVDFYEMMLLTKDVEGYLIDLHGYALMQLAELGPGSGVRAALQQQVQHRHEVGLPGPERAVEVCALAFALLLCGRDEPECLVEALQDLRRDDVSIHSFLLLRYLAEFSVTEQNVDDFHAVLHCRADFAHILSEASITRQCNNGPVRGAGPGAHGRGIAKANGTLVPGHED